MRQSIALAVLLLVTLLAPTVAQADNRPINLALFDPVQIFKREHSIHGFRFNLLYGYNQEMKGLDLGLVNRAGGSVTGLQWGLVHWAEADLLGAQLGFVNYLKGNGTGAQLSALNLADGFKGVQWGGIVNYAPRVTGLQFGLVNITDQLHGLQIGLVNVAKNGFLPVFVIFNFCFE